MDFEFFLPLLAGILTSFTPCVVVLFPITFYRFISEEKINYWKYLMYVFGFIFTFAILGILFQTIFTSQIQNGIKLGIAIILITLGILQFFNKINPLNIKVVKNTFIFGMIFAIAIGINPCALPYLGTLIAYSSTSSALFENFEIFMKFVLFGIGILIPPTLVLMFGNVLLNKIKRASKYMHKIDKIMAILLIVSGVYMGLNILALSTLDIIASSAIFMILILAIIRTFFIGGTLKELLKIQRLLLIISLFILWFVVTYHCYGRVYLGAMEKVCGVSCEICQQCFIIFATAVIIGLIGFFLVERYEKKT